MRSYGLRGIDDPHSSETPLEVLASELASHSGAPTLEVHGVDERRGPDAVIRLWLGNRTAEAERVILQPTLSGPEQEILLQPRALASIAVR